MRKQTNHLGIIITLVLALVIGMAPSSLAYAAENKTVTVLQTSDLHGMFMNYDYAADAETSKGFVKVASVVKEQRTLDPDLLLVDVGDTTQGNLVSDFRTESIHPAIEALNSLKYDAWELGNHEFNFEFDSLQRAIKAFKGQVLAGNFYKNGKRAFTPYFIKDVDGVKVAILGIDAPHIKIWEASGPERFDNMDITEPVDEIGKILDEIDKNEKADVVIALVHYGEDGEYDSMGMYDVAKKYADRVDAFLIGHAHSVLAKYLVNGEWTDEYSKDAKTVLVETGTLGEYVGKTTITVEKSGNGYKAVDCKVENIKTDTYANDPETEKVLAKLHEESLAKANEVIGQVSETFIEEPEILPGIYRIFLEDTALVDLINKVQMETVGADVSLAAVFTTSSNLQKGDYRLKDGVNIYKYDNTLFGVKITGAQLKAIMEQQAGGFFNQYKEGDVTISFNENIRIYNYDMFAGVDYKIDISKPVGERIVDVMYKGEPLKDDEELILAVNNYRYGQLCTWGMCDSANEVYSSEAMSETAAVREIISEYIKKSGGISPECDHNWEIIGYDFSDPQADMIYDMVRNGELTIPQSQDGRTINTAALNAIKLRKEGILPPLKGGEKKADKAAKEYTIVWGDTLWKIAKMFNTTIDKLAKANNIENVDLIYAGATLIIK